MEPILTPAEMADADRRAIAAGTPVEVLMERAGHAVAWEVRRRLGTAYGRRVVVVCGKGNNGGDGLVAARVLRGWGVRADVFELAHGVPAPAFERSLRRADLLVDAMFGTGFRGALEGDAVRVARCSAQVPTVAVDIPSGVDGLTGAVEGDAVRAVATVTFAARKTGLVFEPGRSRAGDVVVADIGIPVRVEEGEGDPALGLLDAPTVCRWLDAAAPPPATHKWRAGVLVVGGSGGMTGAPLMVSDAAMRSGAGIVWCAVPGFDAAARASGGEVITKAMDADAEGRLVGVTEEVHAALDRFRAVAVGPGLGTAEATVAATRELVLSVPVPVVLDADGLNAFAGAAARLRERRAPTVVTPHVGEHERLVGEPVGPDRVAATRRLVEATGAVGLLKGPGTVVAEAPGGGRSPGDGGRVAVNPLDGPWLGTAGSGDVLTGIVAGLLARGLAPFEAAAGAAYVHGLAADVSGHTGLVAGDLVGALPEALRRLATGTPTGARPPDATSLET